MRDPLDELKNLDAGTAGRALPAAEVRRRGDRMRRRRRAVHALGAAAAVAVIASGGALAAGVTSTAPRPVDPAAPTTSTSPSPTETAPAVASEIPEDFPIWEGIEPTEGWGDAVPEGAGVTDLDDELDQSWHGLPCTSAGGQVTFPGDDRRTSALRVWMEGDFWGKSRQLFVYEDFAAAKQAFTRLGGTMTACAKSGETPPGAQPMDWSVESMPGNKDTPSWVIAQGSSTGDGSHAFFVDLTATQVGRSVFVSRSGRSQKERLDWQRLEDSHNVVLRAAWCLWMEGPCGDEPAEPAAVLDESNLLKAGDIDPIETSSGWREQEPQDLPTLSCQPGWLSTLGATEMVYRDFASDDEYGLTGTASTAVLAFEDDSEAGDARDVVQGWIESCDARLDEGRHTLIGLDDFRTVDVGTGEPARWRQVVTAASEVCTDCGAVWFETQGVAQVGDRLVVLQVAVQGGGPTPPGLDERMDTALRAAVEAAGR